jgi:uncharacterized protein involved in exopolysaccharide biosynthesis
MTRVPDNLLYTAAPEPELVARLEGQSFYHGDIERDPWPGWSRLWQRRRTVLASGIVVAALIVVANLLRSNQFTSTASFMAEGKSPTSPLSGLASQFGLNVGAVTSESPDFYADLVTSQAILQLVVDSTVATQPNGPRVSIADLYNVGGRADAVRRERAIERLQQHMTAITSAKTGIVTVRVASPSAFASREIVDRCLRLLNEFNLRRHQAHAATEREFAANQLEAAQRTLRSAEDDLQSFLQSNRVINSPRLDFEKDRLEREVQSKQGLFNTLSQAYEQARLSELRDVPLITNILSPTLPSRPDPRGTVVLAIFGMTFGMFLTGFMLIMADRWKAFRATLQR